MTRDRRRWTGLAATALAAIAAVSGCGSAPRAVAPERVIAPLASPPPSPTPSATPTRQVPPPPAVIATARGALTVFRSPTAAAPFERLGRRSMFGAPRSLLVTAQHAGWVQALLPHRPNGVRGWIPLSEVQLSTTPYRVQVLLRAHRVVLMRGDSVVLTTTVVTGKSLTPTPRGTFYVTDKVRVDAGQPWYGPWALALSAYSTKIAVFNGGDAEIALHGTNEPQLLGTSASHGCVRMPNAVITRLAHLVPLGTPVVIR